MIRHLNCATMCPVAGFMIGQRGLGRGRMVAHCLLVETVRDGLVLVDTGLGTRDVEGKTGLGPAIRGIAGFVLDRAETAIAQVEALGYSAADVRHIVVTHLDVDHAGGLADFPHARVHLHAREHAAAMMRSTLTEKRRYMRAHWAHGPTWELYSEEGDTWRGLPAVKLRGISADIALVPMPGHSRGHSAIAVGDGERWLVHAGDAYYHRGQLDGSRRVPLGLAAFERLTETDAAARRGSLAALRQLYASYPDLELFCAHDAHEYDVTSRPASRT